MHHAFTMPVTEAQTRALSGVYYYDLEVVSGASVVTRLLQGKASVSPEVTR